MPFLKPNHDYVIRFPDSIKTFESVTTETTSNTITTEDGKTSPGRTITFTVRVQVESFTVMQLGKAAWVLLEHPAAAEDFAKWNGKCRAKALLSDSYIAKQKARTDGKDTLQLLRDQAALDIKTTRTWVNLAHAIAIVDVPNDLTAYDNMILHVPSATETHK